MSILEIRKKEKPPTRQHLHGVYLNFVSVDQVECKKCKREENTSSNARARQAARDRMDEKSVQNVQTFVSVPVNWPALHTIFHA